MKNNISSIDYWEETNPSINENSKLLFEKFIQGQISAEKKYFTSYYMFLILSAALFILSSNITNKISILGMEISDISILKWMIPCILCFFHYQGITAMYWENFHRERVGEFIKKHFPSIYKNNLENIISSSSFFNLERYLAIRHGDRIAMVFGITIGLLLVFLPFIILSYFLINNIYHWGSVSSIFLKISVLLISGLFIIRNMFLVVRIVKSNF